MLRMVLGFTLAFRVFVVMLQHLLARFWIHCNAMSGTRARSAVALQLHYTTLGCFFLVPALLAAVQLLQVPSLLAHYILPTQLQRYAGSNVDGDPLPAGFPPSAPSHRVPTLPAILVKAIFRLMV